MIFDKIKPYALAAGLGLAGILGTNAVNAAEPAQTNQEKQEMLLGKPITEQQKEGLRMLPAIPEYLLAYLLFEPFIHESGHALTAKAFGVHIKEYHPYPGKGSLGYVAYDETKENWEKRPKAQRELINVAGLLSSRLTAESLDALMNITEMNPFVEQALAAAYLTLRIEFARYALVSMAENWGKTDPWTGDDIHNIVRLVSKKPEKQKWVYAGLLGLAAADLALDWDELKDNWRRLFMLDYNKKKEGKNYSTSVVPTDGGVQASFTYKF